VYFPGAVDCLRCGHVFGARPLPAPKVVGEPLYPQYRKPGAWAPWAFVVAGLVCVALGVNTALSPGTGSCTGRGATFCLMAAALGEALSGTRNLNLAEGSVWIAFGLLCWSFAWHLHSMWCLARK
jgi:hypothetical protein